MGPRLIIDSHLDLAWNALHLRRDLTRPVAVVRQSDPPEITARYGTCTVTLPELRRGRVGIVFGTVMVRIDPTGSYEGSGMRVQTQCYAAARGHAAYYEALERAGEVRIVRTAADLERIRRLWREAGDTSSLPVGVVMAMESSDPIVDVDQVHHWHDVGVRCASLSHYGIGAWAHGTGTQGGLFAPARELLEAYRMAGIVLDVTHLTDEGLWQALEWYDGPVAASHHNCRTLVPGQRQLDDAMIRELIRRDAVIGTSFDLWMLDPAFERGKKNPRRVGLEGVVDQIDHVCRLAGSTRHAAIGSDLDGGYGLEQSPADMDTVADVRHLDGILERRGYTAQDRDNIFHGNWLRLLGRVLR